MGNIASSTSELCFLKRLSMYGNIFMFQHPYHSTRSGGLMKQPQKWRDTIDPFSLPYHQFTLSKVLGYPHAGNDVFHVEGIVDSRDVTAFLKVERQAGADIANEIRIIQQLPFPFIPKILDYGLDGPRFVVTEELPGERLSVIVGENENRQSLSYLFEYGRALASFHHMTIDCDPVKDRKFFHPLPKEFYLDNDLIEAFEFMESHPPIETTRCFVHGDFHYANILWKDGAISAILDFELAGIGNKEFDIAWACFLRPGQNFLDTRAEVERFLDAYRSENDFNWDSFIFYFLLLAGWFTKVGKSEAGYPEKVRALVHAMLE